MKRRFIIAAAGLVIATSAIGFTNVAPMTSFPARKTVFVSLTGPAGILANRFYCHDGENRLYSNLHRGWVCSTWDSPRAAK